MTENKPMPELPPNDSIIPTSQAEADALGAGAPWPNATAIDQALYDAAYRAGKAMFNSELNKAKIDEQQATIEQQDAKIEELLVETERDGLTGLYNRKYLEKEATKLFNNQHRRSTDPSEVKGSFILMDIDFFKDVNDSLGHAGGDKVLQMVAEVLRTGVKREDDIVARWGGEEFCIMLVGVSAADAANISERIRKAVVELVPNITISAGVSEHEEGETFDDTIHQADKALYLSKRNGRNQVSVRNIDGTITQA